MSCFRYFFFPEKVELWQQAGALSCALRQNGKTVGLSDCLIAVTPRYYGVSLFSFDKDIIKIRDSFKLNLYLP